ncbi:membrane protein [Bacteroidia bacterium]|nr:membrane protein [Bacteroidia bacterium]
MQFLWKYVEDLVGKGVEMSVLAEMFFYASLYLLPTSLPLAVLLASLMTFGNLGEHFELLSMKASGVSLLRIMRSVMVFLIFLAGASFLFQNNIVPETQAKMWAMLASIKNQKPELNIPEGSFFKDITGYNVYVKHKDKTGGMMRDITIYNFSNGFENTSVTVADSGKLKTSKDKLSLILTLYNGETFENYGNERRRSPDEKIPYRRETFSKKEALLKFDSNLNMIDESIFQSREISRNMNQLLSFLDSTKTLADSINASTKVYFKERVYSNTLREEQNSNSLSSSSRETRDTVKITDWDGHFKSQNPTRQKEMIERAKGKIESFRNDYNLDYFQQTDRLVKIRQHKTEIHKRLVLSIACILFFFIGAPLGAIVRKGGIGMPAVLSVFLFISYYTIDIFGLKMARQEIWPVWQGMWLSTFILAFLGIFLTYKAVNDSVMMNPDAWKDFFRRFFGKREVRIYQRKEVIIMSPDYEKDLKYIRELNEKCTLYLKNHKKWLRYSFFWKNGFKDPDLQSITNLEEAIIDDLRNSTENLILGKLMDYPIIKRGYPDFLDKPVIRKICGILFPVGIIIYLISIYKRKYIKQDIRTIIKVNNDLMNELCSN